MTLFDSGSVSLAWQVLAHLASLKYLYAEDGYLRLKTLARRLDVRSACLGKVLRVLCGGGLVEPVRGVGGGFILCKAPKTIRLHDVVVLFDGSPLEALGRLPDEFVEMFKPTVAEFVYELVTYTLENSLVAKS